MLSAFVLDWTKSHFCKQFAFQQAIQFGLKAFTHIVLRRITLSVWLNEIKLSDSFTVLLSHLFKDRKISVNRKKVIGKLLTKELNINTTTLRKKLGAEY